MRNSYKLGVITIAIAVMMLAYWGGCGSSGGGGTTTTATGSSGSGMVSGTVYDTDGQPVEGVVVVTGQNSPNTVTGPDGKFTITDILTGSQAINVICDGFYTLNNTSAPISSNTTINHIQLKELAEDLDNVPQISIDSASISGTTISVSAEITPGANADAITNVRAELLYYNTGNVMTSSGGVYTTTITIPSNIAASYLAVVVFAIDDNQRVGSAIRIVPYSGGTGAGIFTLDTITGTWGGAIKYHRNNTDDNNDKRGLGVEVNTAITISSVTTDTGTASGKCAEPRMYLLTHGSSNPIETVNLNNGNVTMLDADHGLYKIQFDFAGVSRTVTATLLAKCNSAATPTNLSGIIQFRETDTTSGSPVIKDFVGRFHFKDNLSWTNSDFNTSWVLSDYFGISGAGQAFGSYFPPFQYNEAMTIDAGGNVTTGTNTMGLNISNGSFSINDASLGTFSGVITTSDNVATSFYGLFGPKKDHLVGIKKISSGTSKCYGFFWGPNSPNPHFNIGNFASRRIGGVSINSVFIGRMRVITGPNIGRVRVIALNFDASGAVVGGFVDTITGTRIATFTSGSVSSFNTTTGQFSVAISGTLTATGSGCSFTTVNRNASMGVDKARLVGDFIFTHGATADGGFLFMGRLPEPNP